MSNTPNFRRFATRKIIVGAATIGITLGAAGLASAKAASNARPFSAATTHSKPRMLPTPSRSIFTNCLWQALSKPARSRTSWPGSKYGYCGFCIRSSLSFAVSMVLPKLPLSPV